MDASKLADEWAAKKTASQLADEWQTTVPEKEFTTEKIELEKPGFLKSVDMINTGVARGASKYISRLMNNVENLGSVKRTPLEVKNQKDNYGTQVYDYWDKEYKINQGKYQNASLLQGGGELLGEMAVTAPIGGPLMALSKGASALGKMAPYGLGKITEFGAVSAGTGALLSGLEGMKYDPKNPDQSFSTEQAAEALKNPASYIAGAGGHLVNNWFGKARELKKAQETFGNIRNRDIPSTPVDELLEQVNPDGSSVASTYKPSVGQKIKSTIFDSIPNMTGYGKGVKLKENIGTDISNWIHKQSGDIAATYSKDYKEVAGKEFHGMLNRLKEGQHEAWEQGFKTAPVENTQEIKDMAIEAIDILSSSGIPTNQRSINLITKGLQKDKFTVGDVKNIASTIGDAAGDAYAMKGGTAVDMGTEIADIKKNLIGTIKSNLSGKNLEDFNAAREETKRFYDTIGISHKIKAALNEEVAARNLVKTVLSEAEVLDKTATMGLMTPKGERALKAAGIAKALENAGHPSGAVNIGTFLNETSAATNKPELLGDTYKALEGMNVYLQNIDSAGKHKLSGYLGAAGAIAGAAGIGAVATGAVDLKSALPAVAGLASYAVLAGISNRSPLKFLFGNLGKNLSPSAHKHLRNQIEDKLTRGGFFLNKEGVLDVEEPTKKSNIKKDY